MVHTHSTDRATGIMPTSSHIEHIDAAKSILKKCVWLYFFLLIIEGALRKWILPGLSGPLLVVRDPLAIFMLLFAWQRGLLPKVVYVNWMVVITSVAFFTTLFLGHGNISVAVFGGRILLIHFPLFFLIGAVFTKQDVIKMGTVLLYISIPMALLIAMQFYTPQSSLVNRGIGGDLSGSGFSGAMGYFRPTGTFSFTNGTTLFFSLVACFVIYFWLNPNNVKRSILIGSTFSLMAAIPLSISRALLFSVVVTFIFTLFFVSKKPQYLGKIIVSAIAVAVLFILLGNFSFFKISTDVFLARFDVASQTEGGVQGTLVNRYLGDLVGAISDAGNNPFFGMGLGLGTNAGAALLGSRGVFLIAEGEWGRIVGEMGALMGIAVICIRLMISWKVAMVSYILLKKEVILPWLLTSIALMVFPQGQWAQPTTLGFSTLIMGLLIASFNEEPDQPDTSSSLID